MGEETARLREEIDRTRQDLTENVDLLAEKTSPSRIVERRVQRTREGIRRGLTGLREKVMGSPSPGRHPAYGPTYGGEYYAGESGGAGGVSEKLQSARESTMSAAGQAKDQVAHAGERAQEAAHGAVSNVREQAEGNPLAAGLVAFGIGWLVSSLMPASEVEQGAARRAGEVAREHAGPVVEQAKQVAQEVGQELQGHVQEAAEQVKEQAQDAAGSVKEAATTS